MRKASLLSFGLLAVIAASANAAELVSNGSFEIPTPGSGWNTENPDGDYLLGSFDSWTATGAAGVWEPSAGMFTSIPDGTQAGFTGDGSSAGKLTQDLNHVLSAGESIRFSVEFGDRSNLSTYNAQSSGRAILRTGAGTPIYTLGFVFNGNSGQWFGPYVNIPESDLAAHVGQSLFLDLESDAGSQASWDKVSVNAVPEPASMIALGLGAAAVIRRRKQK